MIGTLKVGGWLLSCVGGRVAGCGGGGATVGFPVSAVGSPVGGLTSVVGGCCGGAGSPVAGGVVAAGGGVVTGGAVVGVPPPFVVPPPLVVPPPFGAVASADGEGLSVCSPGCCRIVDPPLVELGFVVALVPGVARGSVVLGTVDPSWSARSLSTLLSSASNRSHSVISSA